jgi:hypothetical protein
LAKNYITEQLKKEFKEKKFFSRESLLDFYRQFDQDLNDSTFRWRIHQLKEKKVIIQVSRDLFTLSSKPDFKPVIGEVEKKIANKINEQFPDLRYLIWSTKSISEFLLHITQSIVTILQVEMDALEPVYDFLKNHNIGTVYVQPDEKEIERYIYESNQSIILQSLITKAPTQKISSVVTVTLEKMIVDLYCDKKLFISYQGSELIHIINTAYERYPINFTTMFHYARRRGKAVDLRQFLEEKTDIPKIILDDKK